MDKHYWSDSYQEVKYQNYKHYKLPVTMDPLKDGTLIYSDNNLYIVQITNQTIAKFIKSLEENQVEIIKGGNVILKYSDRWIDDKNWIRTIGRKPFIITEQVI